MLNEKWNEMENVFPAVSLWSGNLGPLRMSKPHGITKVLTWEMFSRLAQISAEGYRDPAWPRKYFPYEHISRLSGKMIFVCTDHVVVVSPAKRTNFSIWEFRNYFPGWGRFSPRREKPVKHSPYEQALWDGFFEHVATSFLTTSSMELVLLKTRS